MSNNLIVVKQLPIIEQQLQAVKVEIEQKVNTAMNLACTEDTVKEVKKVRANMKKELTEFENQRKQVKQAIIEPYEQFELVYKECISGPYKQADEDMKSKIDSVELGLKTERAQEIKEYFAEYIAVQENPFAVPLSDFITFERANIQITLSTSTKKLKEEAKAFVDSVVADLKLIDTQEQKNDILYEYMKSLNVSEAVTMVSARCNAVKGLEAMATIEEPITEELQEEIDEPLEAPTETPLQENQQLYTTTFKVTATLDKLKKLKQFLNDGGYQYEQ